MQTEDFAIEPYAGVAVTYSHMDSYKETGGNAANLAVDSTNTTNPSTTIGARVGKSVPWEGGPTLNFNASLGWQHNFGNLDTKAEQHFSAGTTNFDTYGPPRDRDAVLVGVGVSTSIGTDMNAYAGSRWAF